MSNKKIGIYCGHGKSTNGSWDCGCTYKSGGVTYTEAEICKKITQAVINHLKDNYTGMDIITDMPNNDKNLIRCVELSNKNNAYHIEIHIDYSGAPSGFMPLYVSSEGKKLATKINNSVKNGMKIKSRGVVKRIDLYGLNGTDNVACIVECGGIKADLKNLITRYDEYGKYIAIGIAEYLGLKKKETKTETAVNYVVSTDGKNVKLYTNSTGKDSGKKIKGAYTIVAELNGYGRLKSGAGWVKLLDVKKK